MMKAGAAKKRRVEVKRKNHLMKENLSVLMKRKEKQLVTKVTSPIIQKMRVIQEIVQVRAILINVAMIYSAHYQYFSREFFILEFIELFDPHSSLSCRVNHLKKAFEWLVKLKVDKKISQNV
mmetsp:Transcript_6814/g.13632  ORF Transcript_6814/g.13632 Transcript_6814/m.13632 type:complete len:122 (+) Transcript_6814:82-447(+)